MGSDYGGSSAAPAESGARSAPSSRGIGLLREAIGVLAMEQGVEGSAAARLTGLRALWPEVCALYGQVADRVRAVHVTSAAQSDGFASTVGMLRRRLRVDTSVASRLVRVGCGLRELGATHTALLAGVISVEHADAIAHIANDLGAAVMADGEMERLLLEYAKVKTPSEVRRLGRLIKLHLCSDEEAEERQVRLYEGRWLTTATTFEGMLRVEAMLDPVSGAQFMAALAAYKPGPDKDRSRTGRQRNADALADIVGVALGNADRSTTGEERPHVTVTVSHETLIQRLTEAARAEAQAAEERAQDQAPREADRPHEPSPRDDVQPETDPLPEADTESQTNAGPETNAGSQADAGPGANLGPRSTIEPDTTETTDLAPEPPPAEDHLGSGAVPRQVGGDHQVSDDRIGGRQAFHGEQAAWTASATGADLGVSAHQNGRPARKRFSGWFVSKPRSPLWNPLSPDGGTISAAARGFLRDYLRPGGPALLGPHHEPISPEAARRIACDSMIIPVVLGSRSEPLDIGRASRTVPLGMRRAVELRDVHCRFPGCDRPAKWCEAHHVRWWKRDEGPTELNNIVLTCKFHHVRVHEYGWVLTFDPVTGTVRVIRPDGTPHDLVSRREGPDP
jgi:hypothetical protein